jgi:hypothetical protein
LSRSLSTSLAAQRAGHGNRIQAGELIRHQASGPQVRSRPSHTACANALTTNDQMLCRQPTLAPSRSSASTCPEASDGDRVVATRGVASFRQNRSTRRTGSRVPRGRTPCSRLGRLQPCQFHCRIGVRRSVGPFGARMPGRCKRRRRCIPSPHSARPMRNCYRSRRQDFARRRRAPTGGSRRAFVDHHLLVHGQ